MSNEIKSRSGEVVGHWDGEDVNELKQQLTAIKTKLRADVPRDSIDRMGIPHRDQFPEDLRDFTPYILWACDKNGVCLVGSGANRIESVESIREHYANSTARDALARHEIQ